MALFSWRKRKKKDVDDEGEMSFLDHLEALRWHIMRSVIAILLFAIVLFSYRIEIIGGIFMSPFDKDFVTYRLLCENFGQLCNNDIRVQGVEVEAPDSLTLEGYMWVEAPPSQIPEQEEGPEEVAPEDPPVQPDQVPTPEDSTQSAADSTGTSDSTNVSQDDIPEDTTSEDTSAPTNSNNTALPPDTVGSPNWVKQQVRLKVSVDQFLQNGQVKGFSVETDKGDFVKFQATSPYEQFMKALLYAFFGGLIFAFPYVVWEIWRFISPALNKRERRLVRWNVFYSSILFFSGILFGYFVILPFSITFLSSFILFDEAENIWRIGDVVNFVLILLFGSGFLFQLPVGIYYASKIGFVTPVWLRKYRKHAVVVLLAIAAIITPPDPASQILIFFPLIGLYEVGIGISARVERRRKKRQAGEKAKDEEWRRKKEEEYKQQLKEQEEKQKQAEAAEKKDQPQGNDQQGGENNPPATPEAKDPSAPGSSSPDPGNVDQSNSGPQDQGPSDENEDDDDDEIDLGPPPEGAISRDD